MLSNLTESELIMPTSTNTLIVCAINKAGECISSNAIAFAVISEWHLVANG